MSLCDDCYAEADAYNRIIEELKSDKIDLPAYLNYSYNRIIEELKLRILHKNQGTADAYNRIIEELK